MRAIRWHGKKDVRVDQVPEPTILQPRDALVEVTLTAICGSDIHLYDGVIPTMEEGDILGHEFMGRIVAVGKDVRNLKVGDRVIVPFPIACGGCWYCENSLFALCDRSNPNAEIAESLYGYSPAGIFGYSHMLGGYPGGQAEYVRVPYADVGPFKVPDSLTDEQVLFLTDVLPTGYMAAENCSLKGGETVAVWGAGPVGLLAMGCALHLGAERIIAIDDVPYRLELARTKLGAEILNFKEGEVKERLQEMTRGRGPDACIDAVGMEAHGSGIMNAYDRTKQALKLETDRPTALRQILFSCRKGGTISIPGVYGGFVDKFPIGSAFNKGLTLRMGQTHVHRYVSPLLDLIATGKLDPTFIISHRLSLDAAPDAYDMFAKKQDDCTKVILRP